MISDRTLFAERLGNISVPANLVQTLSKDGLGQKRKKYAAYKNSSIPDFNKTSQKVPLVGAGLFKLKYKYTIFMSYFSSFFYLQISIRRIWGIPHVCFERMAAI